MNQNKSKLFRYMFHHRKDYRRFKKAYSGADISTRLKTIAMAQRIKATGPVKNIEAPDVR